MKIDTKRLKDELYKTGMSQRQLAKKIGVSAVTVNRYLSGERQPKSSSIVKLSKEFGVSPEYLFGIYDESPNDFFSKVRAEIRTYADGWSLKQKGELLSLITDSILRCVK